MTVPDILALPSHRFTELIAFFEIEPFGVTRDNLHHAQQTALLYNRGVDKRHKVRPVSAFMWRDKVENPRVTAEKVDRFIEGLRILANTDGK